MPSAHTWTGDPARPAFEPPSPAMQPYAEGTTAAVRVQHEGTLRVFTRRYRTVLFAFEVFFGGILAVGPTSEFLAGDPDAIRISTFLVALAFALAGWRTLALGITVRPDGVTVRNFWATRRVGISGVLRFDPPQGTFRGGIRVVRKNGRFISASAFGTMSRFDPPDRGLRETAELNAWLASVTHSTRRPRRPVRPSPPRYRVLWRVWLGAVWFVTALALALAVTNIISPQS